MSSSQHFQLSSPGYRVEGGQRRKSQFTYKQLNQLSLSSTTCPLRVIAHIDLDAFYAQCEAVRLGITEDQPLAVQVCSRPLSHMLNLLLNLVQAMARSNCYQLPCEGLWLEPVH